MCILHCISNGEEKGAHLTYETESFVSSRLQVYMFAQVLSLISIYSIRNKKQVFIMQPPIYCFRKQNIIDMIFAWIWFFQILNDFIELFHLISGKVEKIVWAIKTDVNARVNSEWFLPRFKSIFTYFHMSRYIILEGTFVIKINVVIVKV